MRSTLLFTTSVIVALLLAEAILRLFNPIEIRIRGDRISLRTNTVYDIPNFINPHLSERLIHSRNNIGFRGPDWTASENTLRIFAVGGSTTECFYLSDGLDWPAITSQKLHNKYFADSHSTPTINPGSPPNTSDSKPSQLNATSRLNSDSPTQTPSLSATSNSSNSPSSSTLTDSDTHENHPFSGLWINNAGLDGHSSFGHLILLQDILMNYQPDIILYLVGANDVGRHDLSDHNLTGIISGGRGFSLTRIQRYATLHSELAALVDNLIRGWRAHRKGVSHRHIDFAAHPTRTTSSQQLEEILAINEVYFIPAYRKRLEILVSTTLEYGITPVLLTQPVPYGPGIDATTGIDLSLIEVRNGSGYLRWRELELYNDVTREVARTFDILLIDLERELPKDTGLYYDFVHFTEEGARQIGTLVALKLADFLN
jgi:hypothetical protein